MEERRRPGRTEWTNGCIERRRFGEVRLGETEICRDGGFDRVDVEETPPWRDRDLERQRFVEVKHR